MGEQDQCIKRDGWQRFTACLPKGTQPNKVGGTGWGCPEEAPPEPRALSVLRQGGYVVTSEGSLPMAILSHKAWIQFFFFFSLAHFQFIPCLGLSGVSTGQDTELNCPRDAGRDS